MTLVTVGFTRPRMDGEILIWCGSGRETRFSLPTKFFLLTGCINSHHVVLHSSFKRLTTRDPRTSSCLRLPTRAVVFHSGHFHPLLTSDERGVVDLVHFVRQPRVIRKQSTSLFTHLLTSTLHLSGTTSYGP